MSICSFNWQPFAAKKAKLIKNKNKVNKFDEQKQKKKKSICF